MGGGRCTPPPPLLWFFTFSQNIFMKQITEHSYTTFCSGCPYNFSFSFSFISSQSSLKYGSENRMRFWLLYYWCGSGSGPFSSRVRSGFSSRIGFGSESTPTGSVSQTAKITFIPWNWTGNTAVLILECSSEHLRLCERKLVCYEKY